MAKRGGMKRSHLSTNKEESANDESEAVKSPKKRRIIGEEPTDFGNYLDTERLRGFKCPKKGDDARKSNNFSDESSFDLKRILFVFSFTRIYPSQPSTIERIRKGNQTNSRTQL